MSENDLKGKVALITGTASTKRGMGHAIALQMGKEGSFFAVFDNQPVRKSLFAGDEGWRGLEKK